MSPLVIGGLGFVLLLVLLSLRLPIGLALGTVGFAGFSLLSGCQAGFSMLGLVAHQTASAYSLTVIPLFLLMGQFVHQARLGEALFNGIYRWIGFLPGGLAMATIVGCACFAAVSGSSLATAATLGMVALPQMKRFRYDDRLATGAVAAGGTLGILIPPSTVMVVYGILTGQPIGTLFVAGVLPGLMLCGLFLLTVFLLTVLHPEWGPRGPHFSLRERLESLRAFGGLLGLFALVVGGLYAGWFTPTESAGIGAGGALLLTILKGRFDRGGFRVSLQETTLNTAMIFLILIGANIFGYFLAVSQVPEQIIAMASSLGVSRYAVLGAIVLVYMVLGCLMEGLAIMVLTLPVVFPVVTELGFDPIWFGVVLTILLEMSLITPPVGVNVFVISGVAQDVGMGTIFQGILPFFLAMVLCLLLLILWPQMVLYLPGTMAG